MQGIIKTMESQDKRILNHLKAGKSLTPLEALNLYGCMRLASRINTLRKLNVIKMVFSTGKKKYGIYTIVD